MEYLSSQPGQFRIAYLHALEASKKPPRETVERLILDILQKEHDKRSISPPPTELWPVFSFVREALRARSIPLNWLLGEPLDQLYDECGAYQISGIPDSPVMIPAPREFAYLLQNGKVYFANAVPNIPPLSQNVIRTLEILGFRYFSEQYRHAYTNHPLQATDISSFTTTITDFEHGNPPVYHVTFTLSFSDGRNITGKTVFSFS